MIIGIDIRNIGKKRTGDEAVFFNLVKNLGKIDNVNNYKLFTDIQDAGILIDITNRLGIGDKENFEIVSLSLNPSPKGRGRNRFVWNFWTLPKYLRKNPVDVYHTQYITPFFMPKKVKIITTIHDISFNFYPQLIKFADLFFLKLLIPLSLKRADKIIAVSEFTRSEIIKYYKINDKKVVCAYNAISEDFSIPTTDNLPASPKFQRGEQLTTIREKYNLPENYILYVGTMQPRKNIPLLIKAYAKIKNKLPDIKLVLAGDKESHNFDKNIETEISKNNLKNDIVFPGYIEQKDLPYVFRLAKLFAFPSLYEGFGIPILEAMSQKVPVIISDIPVHREVASGAASYFDPVNLDDFANKIYNILTDEKLRNKLINSGASRVNFFSWRKSAEKLLATYNSATQY